MTIISIPSPPPLSLSIFLAARMASLFRVKSNRNSPSFVARSRTRSVTRQLHHALSTRSSTQADTTLSPLPHRDTSGHKPSSLPRGAAITHGHCLITMRANRANVSNALDPYGARFGENRSAGPAESEVIPVHGRVRFIPCNHRNERSRRVTGISGGTGASGGRRKPGKLIILIPFLIVSDRETRLRKDPSLGFCANAF